MTAFNVPANVAFDSYGELVDAINDWLDRADLTGVAGQMIALAEAKMRRELNSVFDEKSVTISVVNGRGALPVDYSTPVRLVYDERVLPNLSRTDAPNLLTGPKPLGYTIESQQVRLWPVNDALVELFYAPTIPQLTEGNPSNDLLDRQPDLYFFGAMMFAEGYLANDNRALLFKNLFDEALADVKRYYRKQRYGGPLVPNLRVCP